MEIGSLIKGYLPFGLLAIAVLAVIVFVGYYLFYRKVMKGKKVLSVGKLIWLIVFLAYIFVLAAVTLLARGNSYQRNIVPLFVSYREAWYQYSMQDWRNLILNIGIFVPFGFLLPIGISKMRKFWKTALCGFLVTFVIENGQLIGQRGVFECDDILNNTIGGMIGFGLFAICYAVYLLLSKNASERKWSAGRVIAYQLPLILTCVSYLAVFAVYNHQELGNMMSQNTMHFKKGSLQVSSEENYSEQKDQTAVYQLKQMSHEEAEQYAAQFFENIGDTLDAEQSIFYEDTGVFYSENGNDLWLDYTGMTWNFTDFATTYSEDMEENSELDVDESVDGTNSADDRNVNGAESVDDVDDTSTNAIKTVDDADEETIRNALKQYGVDVPEGCIFSKGEDGYYNFSADQIKQGNAMYDGTIECGYYDNGKLGEIWNRMTVSSYYKDFSVISEQDAYERIAKGKFYTWLEDADSYEIEVGKGTLNYEKDSKGFYQPTYLFSATVNGTKSEIAIPAIKK